MARRRAIIGLAAVLLGVAACSSSPRAATTYETWEYSVSIPNDVGIGPVNRDLAYVWAHPETSFIGTSSSTGLSFGFENIRVCSADAMLTMAQRALGRTSAPAHTGPDSVTFGSMTGSVFSAIGSGPDLVGAFACSGPRMVFSFAGGLKRADVEAIMTSFRFRDPPGDPARPPAPGSSR